MDHNSTRRNGETPLYGIVDERTKAIVYRADAYAGRFVLFAVLIDVFLRGLNLNIPFITANWDLLLVVVLGGGVSTIYQIKSRIISGRPLSRSILFLLVVIVVAAIIGFLAHVLISR